MLRRARYWNVCSELLPEAITQTLKIKPEFDKLSKKKKITSAFLAIFIVLLLVKKTGDNSTEHGNDNDVDLFNISPNRSL